MMQRIDFLKANSTFYSYKFVEERNLVGFVINAKDFSPKFRQEPI